MSANPAEPRPIGERRLGRYLMQVLWPAFLSAVVAIGVFFSMVDPRELVFIGIPLADSREGAYTVGFFVFWALFTISSSLTWVLTQNEPAKPVRPAAPPQAAARVPAPAVVAATAGETTAAHPARADSTVEASRRVTAASVDGPTIGGIPVRSAGGAHRSGGGAVSSTGAAPSPAAAPPAAAAPHTEDADRAPRSDSGAGPRELSRPR